MKEGPPLTDEFRAHCSVRVGDIAYLIGGYWTLNKVLAIDVRSSEMTYKSELRHGRNMHACTIIPGSNPKIIVSGGYNNGDVKSTEIYDIENDSWEIGEYTRTNHSC